MPPQPSPFDEEGRYVVILSPSGYEDYFVEMARHVGDTGTLPRADLAQDLMTRYDTVLPPHSTILATDPFRPAT